MKRATYHGPDHRLRLGDDGRILERGVPTEITDAQATRFGERGSWSAFDVSIEDVAENGDDDTDKPQED